MTKNKTNTRAGPPKNITETNIRTKTKKLNKHTNLWPHRSQGRVAENDAARYQTDQLTWCATKWSSSFQNPPVFAFDNWELSSYNNMVRSWRHWSVQRGWTLTHHHVVKECKEKTNSDNGKTKSPEFIIFIIIFCKMLSFELSKHLAKGTRCPNVLIGPTPAYWPSPI